MFLFYKGALEADKGKNIRDCLWGTVSFVVSLTTKFLKNVSQRKLCLPARTLKVGIIDIPRFKFVWFGAGVG